MFHAGRYYSNELLRDGVKIFGSANLEDIANSEQITLERWCRSISLRVEEISGRLWGSWS